MSGGLGRVGGEGEAPGPMDRPGEEPLVDVVEAEASERGVQHELAERMGTSISAISRLESGQHRPNVETLEKLGRAFGERFVFGFEDPVGERELATIG